LQHINYFGIVERKSTSLSRTGEDVALEKHLRMCLQRASQTKDLQQRRVLLTVAVIWCRTSRIEIAATLADLLPANTADRW